VVLHPPLTTSPPVGPLHPSQQTLEGSDEGSFVPILLQKSQMARR
jgi:hypothetical protein